MTAIPKKPAAAWGTEAAHPLESADAHPYILTLCRLSSPVAIPQPRATHLKGLRFFISRSRTPGGGDHWLLHAGCFATADSALECLERLRGLYPSATAHAATRELLQAHDAGIPTLKAAPAQAIALARAPSAAAQSDSRMLSDTEVLQILEQRRAHGPANSAATTHGRDIPVRRPDDTQTLRALKAAVQQNAPVAFAVQLLWSVQPIELAQVQSLPIFRAYTLYITEGRRERRSWYCLRLGFFKDAISAKQVAHFVRSSYGSVAVVPVSEQEQRRADNERIHSPASVASAPATQPPQTQQAADPSRNPPTAASKSSGNTAKPRRMAASRSSETLEQTLEQLALSEVWTDDGSPTDTGVRHLSVTITKRGSGRS
jgi:hypothetical protein